MAKLAYHLRDVQFEHAARSILDIPVLSLTSGRITAVVGPNGAGKSTLLRMLAFLQRPTSGTIQFRGELVRYRERELLGRRRQVTYVAQAPLLFRRTVRANVAYGVRARRLPAAGRVEATLESVGLGGFADRPAWKLSGGEVQRVAIARALAADPPCLLFDEPTASIDRQYVRTIESLLVRLGEAGKTVIFTTHDLEQAYRLSDSIVALEHGHIAQAPRLNILHGAITRVGDRHYFETAGLRIEMPDDSPTHAIAVDADDIIISRRPLESSARNCFPGVISQVARDARGMLLTIDCGCPLLARITPHSYEEMALNIGAQVYVTFKSMAIHGRKTDNER